MAQEKVIEMTQDEFKELVCVLMGVKKSLTGKSMEEIVAVGLREILECVLKEGQQIPFGIDETAKEQIALHISVAHTILKNFRK